MSVAPQCTCGQPWMSVTPPPPCPAHSHYYVPSCHGHCHCHSCQCTHNYRWYQQGTTTTTAPYLYGKVWTNSTSASGTYTGNSGTYTINFSPGYQGPDEEPPASVPVS